MTGTIYTCRSILQSALMVELYLDESSVPPVDADHYRDMAGRLRELACLTPSAGIRKELAALAKRYDGIGGHLDDRSDKPRGLRVRAGRLAGAGGFGRGTSRRTSRAGLSSRSP